MVAARWGGSWNNRGDLPPRKLDSVILRKGQLERLVDDISTFLASEDMYNNLSLPWHRGYLFYGVPGTGKTSVARALADHFGLPVYYLPLGDLEADADLMGLVGAIQPRSVLLIEDIDIYHAATERKEESKEASLAAMLNAIDGVFTPHGLITIMTTNNKNKLDKALLRKGRIDVREKFDVLDAEQVSRLCGWMCGNEMIDAQRYIGRPPTDLIEYLRQRLLQDDIYA